MGKSKTASNSVRNNRKLRLRKRAAHKFTQEEDEEEEGPKCRKKPKLSSNKKNKKKEDPLKPKKPPTAFFYFLEDFRRGYQEENPQIKTMRDIGKACGEKWKTMNYEEKVKYYDIATGKRAEFDKAMAEYIRKKESGEVALSEDSESDSGFY